RLQSLHGYRQRAQARCLHPGRHVPSARGKRRDLSGDRGHGREGSMKAAFLIALLGVFSAFGQKPSAWLNENMPSWLQFSVEYRARLEGFDNGGFKPGTSDVYGLSRLRLNVSILPSKWFRLVGQAQDAHVFWNDRVAS